MYHKINGSRHIILVLYVDEKSCLPNDINLLRETTTFLSINFEMDLNDTSYVQGVYIYQDYCQNILGLSPKGY